MTNRRERPARRIRAGLVCLTAACLLAAAQSVVGEVAVGQPAPAFTLEDPAGRPISFPAAAGGRPAIVFFWATWCPYCRALTPLIAQLREDYRARGVRVFALNVWEDGDPVAYLRERDADFELLLSADEVADAWAVSGTPGLFVVAGDGRIVYRRQSSDGRDPRAAAAFWAERTRAALAELLAAKD